MSKDTMTLFQHLKSIFRHLSWLVFVLLYDSLRVVFLSIVMILLTVFLVLIWLLVGMWLSVRELVLILVEFEDWVQRFGVVRYNIQVSFHFLRNLNQQFVVVLKMVFEVVQRLYIFRYGIKKLKTLLFLKTTKVQKTTESEN